ncbi:MAG: hypothetical protein VR65_28785 [Desulfobulbaceae bacterium BRH_c16a]|nr:MAG: hypothetical protein VR65_28785 [Desulfobulbaceae bacterium BRH_c16a]
MTIESILSSLPTAAVVPVALIFLLPSFFKIFLEVIANNRNHNRETLSQLVKALSEYYENKDAVKSFAIEEAARIRYKSRLCISEIEYFIGLDGAGYKLNDFAKNKPYVKIENAVPVLTGPAETKFLNVFKMKRETVGILHYLLSSFAASSLFLFDYYSFIYVWWKVIISAILIVIAVSNLYDCENYKLAKQYIKEQS